MPESIVQRDEVVALLFAVYDILDEVRRIRRAMEDDGEEERRIWASKEERDAWEAHVDETLARLKALAEKGQAGLDAKRRPARPRRRPIRRTRRPLRLCLRTGRAAHLSG